MKAKYAIVMTALAAVILLPALVWGDDDDDRERGWMRTKGADIAPVDNALYRQECGSCHMAYQPGLMPAPAWEKLMSGLEDHFGDNAELSAADTQAITQYLVSNAATEGGMGRSGAFARQAKPGSIRITENRYFVRKHDEVPKRFLQHEQVGSFSNCIACHRSADKGVYDEHDVRIPGVGRWDD